MMGRRGGRRLLNTTSIPMAEAMEADLHHITVLRRRVVMVVAAAEAAATSQVAVVAGVVTRVVAAIRVAVVDIQAAVVAADIIVRI